MTVPWSQRHTVFVSLATKLEACGNCGFMCGPYGEGPGFKVDLVVKDSSTDKIIVCVNCKKDKNKSVFDL